MGGRRNHEDRRRHDRRVKLAGAGLLAAIAFGVGGHEIAARMDTPAMSIFGPSEPSSSVDVATDFHLPAWDREALEPFIQEAATTHGMSPSLIRAVIQTESRFNPLAVSSVGAQGLMQLMPTTARHVGIENPFDPRENILGGTKYLSTLLDRFKGNTARALAAYNAGPTAVSRHRGLPPYRETQGYVRKIQKLVENTDAEFSLPVTKVRKASLRTHAARKAAVSRNAARGHSLKVKTAARAVKKVSARSVHKTSRRSVREG
jgi:soluble lytic murein transglycosylase-like protein